VLTVGAGTVAAIESSVRTGRPLTHRIVTVAGDGAERAGNYAIAIGTPIRDVIDFVGVRGSVRSIIAGNPMTGVAIGRPDTVVTRTTTAILLAGSAFAPRRSASSPEACTRCGWCLDDCPVGLDPAALLNAAERRQLDRAEALHVHACIGCGLCSFGCPAGLPIAESIRSVQSAFRAKRRDASSDRASNGGDAVAAGGAAT
jgi:electron transport complex protein RnfC